MGRTPTPEEVEAASRILADSFAHAGLYHYYERNGHKNGTGWRDWVLGVVALLTLAGILGAVAMYGDQKSLAQAVMDLKDETTELKKDVKDLTATLRNKP